MPNQTIDFHDKENAIIESENLPVPQPKKVSLTYLLKPLNFYLFESNEKVDLA